jgi:hypothetical protein
VKKQSHAKVPRASRPLKRVYMDFWGLYSKARTIKRYYLLLIDNYTQFSWVFLTKDREAITIRAILEEWLAMVKHERGTKLLTI